MKLKIALHTFSAFDESLYSRSEDPNCLDRTSNKDILIYPLSILPLSLLWALHTTLYYILSAQLLCTLNLIKNQLKITTEPVRCERARSNQENNSLWNGFHAPVFGRMKTALGSHVWWQDRTFSRLKKCTLLDKGCIFSTKLWSNEKIIIWGKPWRFCS